MEVLVFKTNIRGSADANIIKPSLDNCKDIIGWSIDMEDVDNVLRIEAKTDISLEIIKLIKHKGYRCAELE